MAVPTLKSIAISVNSELAILNEKLSEIYKDHQQNEGYIDKDFFLQHDDEISLVGLIDCLSGAEYNASMNEEMAKAIKILQSVKEKIENQKNHFQEKRNNIVSQINNVYKKARIDFSKVIDFENLLFVKMIVKTLDENQRKTLVEIMEKNGFELVMFREDAQQMLFAGVIQDQEKIPKLNRFIFSLLEGKVTNDRSFTGAIISEPMTEKRLLSLLP